MSKILLLIMIFSISLFASIGRVSAVNGEAQILRQQSTIAVVSGIELEEKDIISTKKSTKVQMIFNDGTTISVGSNSKFDIAEYLFDETNLEASKTNFKFLKGAFKSITGKIGKIAPSKFKIKTRTATIGIRGTTIVGDQGQIACTDGAITVTAKGITVDVPAGMITQTPPNAPPTPPVPYKAGSMSMDTNGDSDEKATEKKESKEDKEDSDEEKKDSDEKQESDEEKKDSDEKKDSEDKQESDGEKKDSEDKQDSDGEKKDSEKKEKSDGEKKDSEKKEKSDGEKKDSEKKQTTKKSKKDNKNSKSKNQKIKKSKKSKIKSKATTTSDEQSITEDTVISTDTESATSVSSLSSTPEVDTSFVDDVVDDTSSNSATDDVDKLITTATDSVESDDTGDATPETSTPASSVYTASLTGKSIKGVVNVGTVSTHNEKIKINGNTLYVYSDNVWNNKGSITFDTPAEGAYSPGLSITKSISEDDSIVISSVTYEYSKNMELKLDNTAEFMVFKSIKTITDDSSNTYTSNQLGYAGVDAVTSNVAANHIYTYQGYEDLVLKTTAGVISSDWGTTSTAPKIYMNTRTKSINIGYDTGSTPDGNSFNSYKVNTADGTISGKFIDYDLYPSSVTTTSTSAVTVTGANDDTQTIAFKLDNGTTKTITFTLTANNSVSANENIIVTAINAETATTGITASVGTGTDLNKIILVNPNSSDTASHNIDIQSVSATNGTTAFSANEDISASPSFLLGTEEGALYGTNLQGLGLTGTSTEHSIKPTGTQISEEKEVGTAYLSSKTAITGDTTSITLSGYSNDTANKWGEFSSLVVDRSTGIISGNFTDDTTSVYNVNFSGNIDDHTSYYINDDIYGVMMSSGTYSSKTYIANSGWIVSIPDTFSFDSTTLKDSTHYSDNESSWGYWRGSFDTASPIHINSLSVWVAGIPTPTADMAALFAGSSTATFSGHLIGSVGGTDKILLDANNNFSMTIDFGGSTGNMSGSAGFKTQANETWTITSFTGDAISSGFSASGITNGTGGTSNSALTAGSINGKYYGAGLKSIGGKFDFVNATSQQASGVFKANKTN
ncbi:FecR domain-containing protein [Sulfurimonas sp.]